MMKEYNNIMWTAEAQHKTQEHRNKKHEEYIRSEVDKEFYNFVHRFKEYDAPEDYAIIFIDHNEKKVVEKTLGRIQRVFPQYGYGVKCGNIHETQKVYECNVTVSW
jgi:hypothetical protein